MYPNKEETGVKCLYPGGESLIQIVASHLPGRCFSQGPKERWQFLASTLPTILVPGYSTAAGSLWTTVCTVFISCTVISISLDPFRSTWLTGCFVEVTELKGVTSWVQELGTDFFYARIYGGLMCLVCHLCVTYTFMRADPKIPGIFKKKLT